MDEYGRVLPTRENNYFAGLGKGSFVKSKHGDLLQQESFPSDTEYFSSNKRTSQGVQACFDLTSCPEQEFFAQNRGKIQDKSVRLQDFLQMVHKLSQSQRIVTLGQAKDRIAQLTQLLARKEYQVLFLNKEKDFYRLAFQETCE